MDTYEQVSHEIIQKQTRKCDRVLTEARANFKIYLEPFSGSFNSNLEHLSQKLIRQ